LVEFVFTEIHFLIDNIKSLTEDVKYAKRLLGELSAHNLEQIFKAVAAVYERWPVVEIKIDPGAVSGR
jgi:hypothetical protein